MGRRRNDNLGVPKGRKDIFFMVPISPESEARGLMMLLKGGKETVQSIRSLICITPGEVKALYQAEEPWVAQRALNYRRAILAAFERLLRHAKKN